MHLFPPVFIDHYTVTTTTASSYLTPYTSFTLSHPFT